MTLQLQFIILPLVAIAFLAWWPLFIKEHRKYKAKPRGLYGSEMWEGWRIFVSCWLGVLGGILAIAVLICMIPFSPKYWTYNHVEGTVSTSSNRFVYGTGNLSGDIVIGIAGQPGVYNIQDDRIQAAKIGDHVDLTCTVEWVYAGQDQNNCFIRSWGH
jgi:hypothetical protein